MKKEFKRIYIIGCSGSGKTSLANELARRLHTQHYDLDDIFWKKKYTDKRDEAACRSLLSRIAKKDQWIIEGVYDRWVNPAIKRATKIIWIDISPWLITYRLLRRYLMRRKENQKEQWKDFFLLIKYVWRYQRKDQPSGYGSHQNLIKKYNIPSIHISNESQRIAFLQTVRKD